MDSTILLNNVETSGQKSASSDTNSDKNPDTNHEIFLSGISNETEMIIFNNQTEMNNRKPALHDFDYGIPDLLACTNCRMSHRRCIRLPEGICANCRNNSLYCIYISGRKRGPKTNSQFLPDVNPCETATNALCSSSNDYNIISPNTHNETTETFQNMSISQSFLPSFFPFVHDEPSQNNDPLIVNPYQNISSSSTSHLTDSFSVETPININPYRTAEIFQNVFLSTHEGPAQNNDPLTISSSISYLNGSSSVETPININPYGTDEIFQNVFLSAHEEPAQNNDPLTISSSINYLNDSSSVETPININPYGTDEIFQN
ncbi:14511_t:CDS:2, partial [Dentiscutata heterogama]